MPNGDPLRLRVLKGLTALIKTVTPANGYTNDLSDFINENGDAQTRVFRGRNLFGSTDPLPMIAILENPHAEPTQHQSIRGSSRVEGPWEILIQGFAEDDQDNPSDPMHLLMAEVKMALVGERMSLAGNLYPNVLGCGRAVTDMMIGAGVVRPVDDVSAKGCFWLMLTLEMDEDLLDPFATA